jgi:hypothetical protein
MDTENDIVKKHPEWFTGNPEPLPWEGNNTIHCVSPSVPPCTSLRTSPSMTLTDKLNQALMEYDSLGDKHSHRGRFLYRQIESFNKAIAYYSSPQYLNRKPLLREIVNAEKTIETVQDVKNVFGIQ